MTRLTSNIARSSWVASCAGGTGRAGIGAGRRPRAWSAGPPVLHSDRVLRGRAGTGADAQDLHDHAESRLAEPHYAPDGRPARTMSIFLRDAPERARRSGWTAARIDPCNIHPVAGRLPPWSPGALTSPPALPTLPRVSPICSRSGRGARLRSVRPRAAARPPPGQLRWNNPKLHTPDYRKTWLACDEHRESLGDFLDARGFLREVTPVPRDRCDRSRRLHGVTEPARARRHRRPRAVARHRRLAAGLPQADHSGADRPGRLGGRCCWPASASAGRSTGHWAWPAAHGGGRASTPVWRSIVTVRAVRAWGYAERDNDLLVRHGLLVRRLSIVPYARMQFVDVTAGPLERAFGLATVQLHTAAAASDARVPGLPPAEAARLRDRLTALGEDRAEGL